MLNFRYQRAKVRARRWKTPMIQNSVTDCFSILIHISGFMLKLQDLLRIVSSSGLVLSCRLYTVTNKNRSGLGLYITWYIITNLLSQTSPALFFFITSNKNVTALRTSEV
jgi:hypothetical protein